VILSYAIISCAIIGERAAQTVTKMEVSDEFGIANLPSPTARMKTSSLLIGSAGTATFSHPVQTLAVLRAPPTGVRTWRLETDVPTALTNVRCWG
jgi:hypothetical protein